jgi:hypothetical protein
MIKNQNNLPKKEFLKKCSDYNNWIPFMMVIAVILSAIMALNSPFNLHPDEKERFFCAQYYENNWLPPKIGNPETFESYSLQGNSRLNELRIDFFLYGKFSKIFSIIIKNELIRLRLFGILLLLILTVICIKNIKTRILFLPLVITPQVWYVFSYINDDIFPLFLSFIAIYQIINENSGLNRFLNSEKIFKSIAGGISFGILLGILAISKLSYVLFLIFIIIIIFILFIEKKDKNKKQILKKYLFIVVIAILTILVIYLIHININGLDRAEKILAYKENITRYEFKPSTIKNDPQNAAWFVGMKDKGVKYYEVILDKGWVNSNWKTFVGGYGYTSIFAGNTYYIIMKILYILFFIFVVIILLKPKDKEVYLLIFLGLFVILKPFANTEYYIITRISYIIFFIFTLVIMLKSKEKYIMLLIGSLIMLLVFASSMYSWIVSLQPQGRYLFPVLSAIGFMLYRNKEKFNKAIISVLLLLLFLMSVYSFIFVALKNLIVL